MEINNAESGINIELDINNKNVHSIFNEFYQGGYIDNQRIK